MKRTTIAGLIGAASAASLALGACSGSQDPGTGTTATTATLTVYHSEEGFDVLSARFAEYYEAATGVTVTFESFHQAGGELRSAVELELQSGSVNGDVMIAELSELVGLQERYDPFETLEIPADFEIPDQLRQTAERYGFMPYILSPYIIVYNSDLVAADEVPSSWLDLLDERWSGLIGMGDPETTSGAHAPLWFFVDYLKDEPGFGWSYYEEIGKLNPTTASSHGSIYEQIAGGELQVGLLSYPGLVSRAEDGLPLDGVIPEEGVPSLFTVGSVFSDSDDAELATAFVEWLASPGGQEAVQDGQIPYVPVRTDVEVRTWDSVSVEVPVASVFALDPVWVSEHRDENVQMFRDRVG